MLIACDTCGEDGSGTKVVAVERIDYPCLRHVVGTVSHVVVVVEDGAQGASITIDCESYLPDCLARVAVGPDVLVVVHLIRIGVGRSLIQSVKLAAYHLRGVLDGVVPTMHI